MAAGERCTLGQVFWLTRCGQRVPEHAARLAADVAALTEGYSPVLTARQVLEQVDMPETLSDGERAEDGRGPGQPPG